MASDRNNVVVGTNLAEAIDFVGRTGWYIKWASDVSFSLCYGAKLG